MMRPRQLFRHAARAEAVTWTLLILGMVLKYVTRTTDLGVTVFGLLHGIVFLSYFLVCLTLWVNHRWRAELLALALACGVPPFATLWFERWADRRRELSGDWRLTRNGSWAYTTPERILAWAARHVALAVLLAGLAIVGTTAGLLFLGPPWVWAAKFLP